MKIRKPIATSVFSGAIVLLVSSCLTSKPFGALPHGEAMTEITQSVHYKNGRFENLHHTPNLAEGTSTLKTMWHNMHKEPNSTPKQALPVIKTDLKALSLAQNTVVWMGHSSSFIQVDGKRILIDPVLQKKVGTLLITIKGYKGTNLYTAEDIPEIDVMLISHDHWDHLDYKTVSALRKKVKLVICGLGTGSHFRRWGYAKGQIKEADWGKELAVDSQLMVAVTPARHSSGRVLKMKRSLWASYVIRTEKHRLFYSGDTGYDNHFAAIGKQYGPFDLALIECGQYDKDYPYIHMQPEQSLAAARDLNAKRMLPVHWARFTESRHAWNEPIKRIKELAQQGNMPLATPMIGQPVNIDDMAQSFENWWEAIR